MWFWFHSAVEQEPWVLVMCLFGLVRGELLHTEKKTTTTVSNTSYIPSLLGNKERMKTGDAKYKKVKSVNTRVSLMMQG